LTTAPASDSSLDRLLTNETFPPTHGTDELNDLRNEVLQRRQAAFAALMLRLTAAEGDLANSAGAAIAAFMELPRETRMVVVGDPAFAVWLHRATHLEVRGLGQSGPEVPPLVLADFSDVLGRCLKRMNNNALRPGMPIEVLRYDVDPLVAEIAPPTYTFPTPELARELEAKTAYSLDVFQSVAGAALLRIGRAWPELGALFPRFVRAIVHLPYADFRSASASRYAGLIFLTADDRTILEVEESLVHEWGHQVLYSAMELDPIVVDGERGNLSLPWSGARRDFYGYFHALFVYTLLLRYLEQIDDRELDETDRIRERFGEILRGAVAALPDFRDDTRFTRRGRELRRLLQDVVVARAKQHGNLIGNGGIRG
jgi:hypothetical protein